MTTCLMPPCADHATRTWSAVSFATVDGSAGRFVATAIAAESRPRKGTTAGALRVARIAAKVWILDDLLDGPRHQPLAAEHDLAEHARARGTRGSPRVRLAVGLGPLLF